MKKGILLLLPFLLLVSCQNNNSQVSNSINSELSTSVSNSSESVVKTYKLSSNIENGNVKFKVNEKEVDKAEVGATVNVYLTIIDGYKFKEFSNKDLTFTEVEKDKVYSFIMPNKDVTISVVTEAKKEVKLTSIKAFSSNVTNITDLTGKVFYEGEEFSFNFNGLENREYKFFVNDTEYKAEKLDNNQFKATFVVPNKEFAIEIYEYYKESSTGVTVTFNSNDVNYKVYGIENNKTYEVTNTLEFYIVGKYGVKVSGNYVLDNAGGMPLNIANDGKVSISLSENTKTVRINIEASLVGAGNISFNKDDQDKLKIDVSKTINVFYGEFISITVTGLTGYKPISATVTDDKNSKVNSNFIPSNGLLTFTMPKSNVLIDFEIATPKALAYTSSEALKSGKFYVNSLEVTSAFPTDDVEFDPTLNDGYLKSDATFYYQEGKQLTKRTDASGEVRFSFTMPLDGDVNITCEADKYYAISFVGDSQTFSVPNKNTMYKEGQQVSLSINPTNGYKIISVTLDGQELTLTNGKYVFTMPNKNVSINVNTEKVKTVSFYLKKDDKIVKSFDAYNGDTKIDSFTPVDVGSTITLKFSFNTGYEFKSLTSNNPNVKFTKVSDLEYTFVVLEMDDTLDITLEGQKVTYPAINVTDSSKLFTSYDIYSTSVGRKNGIKFPYTDVPVGEKATIYVHATKDTVDASTFKVTSSVENINLNVSKTDQGYTDVTLYFSFTMPTTPVTFTINIDKKAVEEENTNKLLLSMDTYKFEYKINDAKDYVQTEGKFKNGDTLHLHSLLTEDQFNNNDQIKKGDHSFGFEFYRIYNTGSEGRVGKLIKITSIDQENDINLNYTYYSWSKLDLHIRIGVFETSDKDFQK